MPQTRTLLTLVSKDYKVAVCEPTEGETNVKRVIAKQPNANSLVDLQTGEILQKSEQERSLDADDDFPLSAFDKDAMAILLELFDGIMDLQ